MDSYIRIIKSSLRFVNIWCLEEEEKNKLQYQILWENCFNKEKVKIHLMFPIKIQKMYYS